MGYFLWQALLGKTPRVEIEQTEYEEILYAWKDLAVIAEIEETWDSLIQNYVELETELLNSAIHSMVRSHGSYHDFQDTRLGFARRLSNLLQTCRSYLDHTPHHLGKLQVTGLKKLFAAETSKVYDANFSYRFMEALRNYSQHRGVPMHSASFDARWIESEIEEESRLRHTVVGLVKLKKIREDKEFKAAVLAEIEPDRDTLDVAKLAREYMEGLGAVHDALRAALTDHLNYCKSVIRSALERYGAENEGDVLALAAAEFAGDGTVVEYQNIFEELLERIEKLAQRNGSLVNLRRRYVSGELLEPKPTKRRR